MGLINDMLRRKPVEALQGEAASGGSGLRRVLGLWQLTAIGLGGIIGVGIFVLTGTVAATQAGPAVLVSFIIAGIASAAAALCYAEFAGLIPVSGSAYTYGYAVLGEFAGWIIGWESSIARSSGEETMTGSGIGKLRALTVSASVKMTL